MALAAAMLVAAGLLCLAGCGGQDAGQKEGGSASANANANGTGTLRVGVRADVVGFGYFNERANNYYGLEIDLARELASRNVTVNAVAPGFIETDMTAALPEAVRTEMAKDIPAGRAGQPEDVANAVAFFAAEQSSYLTGQVLCVDGGMAM